MTTGGIYAESQALGEVSDQFVADVFFVGSTSQMVCRAIFNSSSAGVNIYGTLPPRLHRHDSPARSNLENLWAINSSQWIQDSSLAANPVWRVACELGGGCIAGLEGEACGEDR